MVHLTLAGLSEDGKRLLLLSDTGAEFTLDVDTKLKAVLRGDSQIRASLGQLEIKMESTLRPRDIQARIRAGETPEAVARRPRRRSTRSWPYAAPVLAERQHVAERAQRSSVRRQPTVDRPRAPHRTLGDAVAATSGPRTSTPARRVGRLATRGRPLDADRDLPRRQPFGRAGLHLRRPRQLRHRSTTTRPAGWSATPCRSPLPSARSRRRTTSRQRPASAGLGAVERPTSCRSARTPSTWATIATTWSPSSSVEAFLDDRPRRPTRSSRPSEAELREETDASRAPRPRSTTRSPAAGPARSAAGPRSRAGTRSCSAAASTTESAGRCLGRSAGR